MKTLSGDVEFGVARFLRSAKGLAASFLNFCLPCEGLKT